MQKNISVTSHGFLFAFQSLYITVFSISNILEHLVFCSDNFPTHVPHENIYIPKKELSVYLIYQYLDAKFNYVIKFLPTNVQIHLCQKLFRLPP